MGCCGKVKKGVIGLTKAAFGVDRASDELIATRRDICRTCGYSAKRKRKDGMLGLTTLSTCSQCGCFIAPKTTIKAEKCKAGLW